MWYARFDDSNQEEEIRCGDGYYDANRYTEHVRPLGMLELATSNEAKVLRCRNPISGDLYMHGEEVIEIPVMPDLLVGRVREAFERHCGDPNGLKLLTPHRALDPFEDDRRLDETLNASEDEIRRIMARDNVLVLELFEVNTDGTERSVWHSDS